MAVYNYAPNIFDNVCFSAVVELEDTCLLSFWYIVKAGWLKIRRPIIYLTMFAFSATLTFVTELFPIFLVGANMESWL